MATTGAPDVNFNYDNDINEDGNSSRPFVDQPAYGRGLWRSPIKFVPASSPHTLPDAPPPKDSIAEQYLAIVFPNGRPEFESDTWPLCDICGVRFNGDSQTHVLSFVHRTALPSPPAPSSMDRKRYGLKYMKKYGWDVDSRMGLGVEGQGMLFPLILKPKMNTHGLGFQVEKRGVEKEVMVKLDAGKVRKMVESEKKKDERMRRMFYGDEKVEKYLGKLG